MTPAPTNPPEREQSRCSRDLKSIANYSEVLNCSDKRRDDRKERRKLHDNLTTTKARHKKRRKQRMCDHMLTFVRSNERKQATHKSGVMAPDGEANDNHKKACGACGLTSHQRRSSRLCLKSANPTSQCHNCAITLPGANSDTSDSDDSDICCGVARGDSDCDVQTS